MAFQSLLLLKLFELAPERKKFSIDTNQKFIYRFLRRNRFSFRSKVHYGQIHPKNCFTQTSLFLNEIWDKRLENRDLDNIIRKIDDETRFFFNMVPSKTID